MGAGGGWLRWGRGALAALGLWGCVSQPVYREAFGELDQDASGGVEWREFRRRFPEAAPKVFLEADADKDGTLQPAEWERFQALQPK
jgi:hypothetical protein